MTHVFGSLAEPDYIPDFTARQMIYAALAHDITKAARALRAYESGERVDLIRGSLITTSDGWGFYWPPDQAEKIFAEPLDVIHPNG